MRDPYEGLTWHSIPLRERLKPDRRHHWPRYLRHRFRIATLLPGDTVMAVARNVHGEVLRTDRRGILVRDARTGVPTLCDRLEITAC